MNEYVTRKKEEENERLKDKITVLAKGGKLKGDMDIDKIMSSITKSVEQQTQTDIDYNDEFRSPGKGKRRTNVKGQIGSHLAHSGGSGKKYSAAGTGTRDHLGDIEEESTVAEKDGKKTFNAKLQDNTIIKMLEMSMEEMIMFEVNLNQKPTDQPFLEYREVFRKFLLKQYGLPNIADTYFHQVLARIQEFSKVGGNFYA